MSEIISVVSVACLGVAIADYIMALHGLWEGEADEQTECA